MDVRSLAWRTDIALLQQSGSTVSDHGDHLVVRTPENPAFYWGNFLLLAAPPPAAEARGWVERFEDALPGSRHRTFGLDQPHAATDEFDCFARLGYSLDCSIVLTTDAVHPPERDAAGVALRPLLSDEDWTQRVALAHALHGEGDEPGEFLLRRARAERRRCESGHGAWFGAFEGDRLLSALGIFRTVDGLARYQDVETHPAARRRGLASALLHHAGLFAAQELGATKLVIVADPDYHALRLYRSLGFTDSETQLQAQLSP